MTTTSGAYQIHSEARGPHWIAWITRGGESKPDRSIVLVAATQGEAEERARHWAEQTHY
jgi:hypothetical protein